MSKLKQVKWNISQKFGFSRNKKRSSEQCLFSNDLLLVGISFASTHKQLKILWNMLLPFRFPRWPSKEWVLTSLSNYSCPGHRPWARAIKCAGFSSARKWTNCAIVPMRPLRPSHASFPWQLKRSVEETKRPGFFKNACHRNVRKVMP